MFDFTSYKDKLSEIIRINTVNGNNGEICENAPLGTGIKSALDYMLALGNAYGFDTKNLDGYCGYIEMGDKSLKDMLGILVHIDTVGVDSMWQTNPFELCEKDDKLFARGVLDDKGPALLMLYVMNELSKLEAIGINPNMRIRLIIGGDEESGENKCIQRYKKTEEIPSLSFSPDANFPVVYGEKGILRIKIFLNNGIPNFTFSGGDTINVVPCSANATVCGTNYAASGEAAHASTPELGDNAVIKLSKMLKIEGVCNSFIELLDICNVKGLNIALQDSESALTINPAIAKADAMGMSIACDIRYNVSANADDIIKRIKNAVSPLGFDVEKLSDNKPLYVDKSSDFIKKLSLAYTYVTGDFTKPLLIGGGTYAREFENCVAFGPEFPNSDNVCHMPNEYWSISDIRKSFSVYFEAIKAIAFNS